MACVGLFGLRATIDDHCFTVRFICFSFRVFFPFRNFVEFASKMFSFFWFLFRWTTGLVVSFAGLSTLGYFDSRIILWNFNYFRTKKFFISLFYLKIFSGQNKILFRFFSSWMSRLCGNKFITTNSLLNRKDDLRFGKKTISLSLNVSVANASKPMQDRFVRNLLKYGNLSAESVWTHTHHSRANTIAHARRTQIERGIPTLTQQTIHSHTHRECGERNTHDWL